MFPLYQPTATGKTESHQNNAMQLTGMLLRSFWWQDDSEGALHYVSGNVSKSLVSCCILHAIGIRKGQPLPQDRGRNLRRKKTKWLHVLSEAEATSYCTAQVYMELAIYFLAAQRSALLPRSARDP
eukprot:g38001.t1